MVMKTLIASLALAFAGSTAIAGSPVSLDEIPSTVSQTLEEYFPGSEKISAERDTDNGREKFEVKIQYKAIKLEVDVAPDGRILDVDME